MWRARLRAPDCPNHRKRPSGSRGARRMDVAQCSKEAGVTMADEPISPERFAVLVDRAGLKLTPEQFEELRQGYRFVERMIRSVRRPRDRAAEPAHIFIHPKE